MLLQKLYWCLLHPIQAVKAIFGRWPSDIPIKKVISELPSDAIIIEAGVGEGVHTRKFAEKLPQGTIFGLEPIEPLYLKAKWRLKSFANVKLFNLAFVETGNSRAKLYTNFAGSHESSSLLQPTDKFKAIYPDIEFNSTKEIQGITLDDFCRHNRIFHIDLLWLDLQGSEMSILKNGGLETLERTRLLHVEVLQVSLYKEANLMDEFLAFLQELNFRVIDLKLGFAAGNALLKNNRNLN